jgi:tetratricopeptide (TPR) repeat protein
VYDLTRAWADLDAAVNVDATFPDARVFRAIMFNRDSKWTEAYVEYKAIDVAKAPRDVVQLLVGTRLQERILAALVGPKLLVANPPVTAADGSSAGFSAEEIRLAADQLAEDGRILDALRLLDRVLGAAPDNASVIATRGWITGRLGQQLVDAGKVAEGQQQLVTSRAALDMAVRLDPAYLHARVYRAFVLLAQNLPKDADADLDAYEAASAQPVDLQLLVSESGLRAAIDAALKK